MLPLVSVVIPVYRRQRELIYALRSLESEARLIHEIVVVDDGSPEPVVITAPPSVAAKIRLIRLDRNLGSSGARQAGIDHAQGHFIAFLDSDDAWLPGKLAAQLPLLDAGNDRLVVVCGWQTVDLDRGTMSTRFPLPADDPVLFASGCWFCPGTTAVVPRAAFERTGGYSSSLRRLEDLDWYLRLSLGGGRIVVAPVVGALIRRAAKSNRKLVADAVVEIRQRFLTDRRTTPAVRRNLEAWLETEQAFADWTEGHRASAIRRMLRSMAKVPRLRLQLQDWWRLEAPTLARPEVEARLGL